MAGADGVEHTAVAGRGGDADELSQLLEQQSTKVPLVAGVDVQLKGVEVAATKTVSVTSQVLAPALVQGRAWALVQGRRCHWLGFQLDPRTRMAAMMMMMMDSRTSTWIMIQVTKLLTPRACIGTAACTAFVAASSLVVLPPAAVAPPAAAEHNKSRAFFAETNRHREYAAIPVMDTTHIPASAS